jgi:energy-coupling factor transport system permease protein
MNRGIRSCHPFVSFFYYVFAAVLLTVDMHPVFLLAGALVLIGLHLALDRGKTLAGFGKLMVFMALFFLIINPLVNHRGTHILFYFHQNPIMLESVMQGVIYSLTIFSLLLLFGTYNHVITAEKFLFLFSKWLPQWALLVMLSLRFVPLLKRRLNEIELVQLGKGLSIHKGTIRERSRSGLLFVQILLTWSLEEAIQTADSMAARGYGIQKRSKYTQYKMHREDWIALVYLLGLGGLSLFGCWLGDGVLSIYPNLEPVLLEGREWFYLVVFVLYIGFPLLLEGKEAYLWHYS